MFRLGTANSYSIARSMGVDQVDPNETFLGDWS